MFSQGCMVELRRANADRPPGATDAETPKLPFGSSFAPNFDKSALAKIIPKSTMHTGIIFPGSLEFIKILYDTTWLNILNPEFQIKFGNW